MISNLVQDIPRIYTLTDFSQNPEHNLLFFQTCKFINFNSFKFIWIKNIGNVIILALKAA